MRDHAALEIRRVREQLEQVNRRVAMANLPGKVAQVDAEKRLLRLKLGTTRNGEDILSPWVRWQEAGAGGLKMHSQPAIGEQMVLSSVSGTVGAASMAMPATYDQDNESPSKSEDTAVFTRGGGRIELGPDGIKLIGNVRAEGGTLTHNDVFIGDSHAHTKVFPGGALSGPPPS